MPTLSTPWRYLAAGALALFSTGALVAVRGEPGPRGLVPAARQVEAWLKANVPRS